MTTSSSCRSAGGGMLVDIFLLRVVNAHERFDGLDDALRIANEIPIGVLRLKAI